MECLLMLKEDEELGGGLSKHIYAFRQRQQPLGGLFADVDGTSPESTTLPLRFLGHVAPPTQKQVPSQFSR